MWKIFWDLMDVEILQNNYDANGETAKSGGRSTLKWQTAHNGYQTDVARLQGAIERLLAYTAIYIIHIIILDYSLESDKVWSLLVSEWGNEWE